MNKHFFKAQSPEWFELRKKHITGTEVPSLYALNPYLSAVKVMQGKDTPVKLEDNDALRAGRILEPGVVVALTEMGIDVKPAALFGEVCVVTKKNISVSLDAIATDESFLVECKTTEKKFEAWKEGFIPINYLLQCQVQLLCTGLPYALLACMHIHSPFPIVIYKVVENKELQKIIIDTVDRFWDNKSKEEKFKVDQDEKKAVLGLLENTIGNYEL